MSFRSMDPCSRYDFIVSQMKNHIETLEAGLGERLLRNAQESISILSIELGNVLSEPEFRDPSPVEIEDPPNGINEESIVFYSPNNPPSSPPHRQISDDLIPMMEDPDIDLDLGDLDLNDSDDDYVADEYETVTHNLRFKFKPKLKIKRVSKEDTHSCECPICYETYGVSDQVVYGCGHMFCGDCTIQSLTAACINSPYQMHHKCPMCREEVSNVTVKYNVVRGTRAEVLKSNYLSGFKRFCVM